MATANARPAGGVSEPTGSGRPPFADALAHSGVSAGGYPDVLAGTLGDAAGGMIGGIAAEPLSTTTVADAFGDPGSADGYRALAGYGDVLSVTAPPARPATPAEPAGPAEPTPPTPPAAPRRRGPVQPDGVLRPPGWRPAGRSTARRPSPAVSATPARTAGRPPAGSTGAAPDRISRSADNLPSGERGFRWVGPLVLLVVGLIVFGNAARGCQSRLAGQVDTTRPAHVAAEIHPDVHHAAVARTT